PYNASPPPTRPFVTLTFAQSLDGKIAGAADRESMVMTHWLRTLHDAILVGSGTALNDDPQLNTRHLPSAPLDAATSLRLPSTCKLIRNHTAGTGRRPWVISSVPSPPDAAWQVRCDALTIAGARVLLLPCSDQGVRSLMVEGGARVIGAFFNAANCIDTVLITTAPLLVGAAGVGYAVSQVQVRANLFLYLLYRWPRHDTALGRCPCG
ncbi:dihydrofolate reductase-like domain-containing protein, partial [Mycena polygramma]